MAPAVATLARMVFEVDVPAASDPVGLLIGEQPGAGHNPRLPLWPYPPSSAGARLYRMSGMPIGRYLTRLARVNMAHRPVGKWDARRASDRLHMLAPRLAVRGSRGALWRAGTQRLQPDDRDPENVERARRILRWAAGVEV